MASSPPSSPTPNSNPVATAALRTFLVARKVSSSSRSQVPRCSFPPDTYSSRVRTSRPSPLGPKGGRKLAQPSSNDKDDGDDWSSDAGGERGGDESNSTTDDDDGDLGVVKRAKSRKFAKGVGKVRFFSAPNGRRRERTPSYSPKKEKNDGCRLATSPSSSPPSRSIHSSPSKPLRATSTPFTLTSSRLLNLSDPATTPSKEETKQPSFSPESIASGTSFQNVPSPTSSQSSWSLITPGIPQNEVFDTSIDSIIIIHDLPTISERFVKGPSNATPPPTGLLTVFTTAPTPTPLSPFAEPFVSTHRRTHYVERSIDFAELMGRGMGMGRNDATPSSSSFSLMQEKKGSPERQVLRREIVRAATPSKPSREQVGERMARLIMKRSVGSMAFGEQGGDPIAVMVGPESLPYARNPSGVDGSVVGSDGRLNVWMSSAQDPECEYVEAFQRRPGSSNMGLRGNQSNSIDSSQAQAYSHPSVFRIQPHGRGRIIPQLQGEQHRPPPLPFKSSPLVSSIHACPSPSPSYSVSSFDSRACFPPPRYGPSPTEFTFPSLPPGLQHPYHQQDQPYQQQFEGMTQQSRQLSNQELFEVASNILGIGLGRPSAFARSQFSGSGVSTPSSLGPDFERQASQLERILLLSTIASTLRSASDSVVSTIPTREAPTPRSISSPAPGSQIDIPAIVPSFNAALPVVQEPTTTAPVLLEAEPAPAVARAPYPHGIATIPLPPIDDVAITRVGQQQPQQPTEAAVVDETRARTETYQVRRDVDATRSRANTIDSRSPIGSSIHNHSQHDENFIFLRAGKPPGFLAGGARRPGPRAGLPPRTMAMRAIDAMTKASLREGKGGGALVASERKEVLERGEKVVDGIVAPIQVGALWKVRAAAAEEEEEKVGEGDKKGGKRAVRETRSADGFLTLGSLSAMFGESSKTNVPASLPSRPKQEKPKSFVAALSVGLPKKPDFPTSSPLPSPTALIATRASRSPSVIEATPVPTPTAPRITVVASPKAKDGKSRSRKRSAIASKVTGSALRTDGGAC